MPPKGKLSEAELKQRRDQQAFARRIRTTFVNAGFVSLPTNGIHRQFGNQMGELDHVFVFENIVVICEDTTDQSPRDHLKKKKVVFDQLLANKKEFIDWITTDFSERLGQFDSYGAARYKVFILYFSKLDMAPTKADIELFDPIRIVRPASLAYLSKMALNIRKSSRNDIFRFLDVHSNDLGAADSSQQGRWIPTTIIYPTDSTGFENGVHIVSFMMSAEVLLRNSYVLRKDNWEERMELYQRLIERDRIQSIRKYLAEHKRTFINNIIVSLPTEVEFKDAAKKKVLLENVSSFDHVQMLIPDEMNSICVIDGQHRIFAHYEGTDALEAQIAPLRKKLHLLVTGLIYPASMSTFERRKFEAEIFLDINSNAKPVPPDVLLFIERLKDPFSDRGVARAVLSDLNQRAPLENRFQLSALDDGKVKIASIIKFALRYLVAIDDDPNQWSLFSYWSTDKDRAALLKEKSEQSSTDHLEQFVEYAGGVLSTYFGAVRKQFAPDWDDPESRLLSTTAINGFLIALRKSLAVYGVLSFDEYRKRLGGLTVDFSKTEFPFTSSQYAKFSRVILKEVFDISDEPKSAGETEAGLDG